MNVSSLVLFVIYIFLVNSAPFNEDYNCDYEDCKEEDYFCATNGNEFQYFKNDCYMKAFNDCNNASKENISKIV